jgi:peptidoglycan/xylan/chitin deacetylase (PgdA/CDA1 family)
LVGASLAVHVGAAGLLAAMPEQWPLAVGSLVLDHALLTGAGLWPRSRLLGPNWTRLPATAARAGQIAITIDDGPDPEVTPRVLDLLAAHGAVATFFCIGERAARHATLCRDIVRRGHAVENHSQRHRHNFSLLGPGGIAREVATAQDTLADLTGERPRFFRAPAGLRNPFLDPVLHRQGLQLAAWTRRGFDTREGDPQRVLQRLTDKLQGGDILLLHDSNCALAPSGLPVILEVLPALLERIAAAGLQPVTLRKTLA